MSLLVMASADGAMFVGSATEPRSVSLPSTALRAASVALRREARLVFERSATDARALVHLADLMAGLAQGR